MGPLGSLPPSLYSRRHKLIAEQLEARKQRNRASAEASRKRVRDQMENLENMNALLEEQVAHLKQRLAIYEQQEDTLSSPPQRRRTNGCTTTNSVSTSSASQLNSLEPAAFIEQPFRMTLLAAA